MKQYTFDDFMDIIRRLRAPGGCPWDREQTHESLVPCIREEAYEVIDAIEKKDAVNLREELGDLLLQVAMHAAIGEEEGEFTIEEVISEVSEKMIRRHPHVFSDARVENSKEVLKNWEDIKREEHKETNVSESLFRVARALPSNIRAEKVQKKAAKAGYDFEDKQEVWKKMLEELSELREAMDMDNNVKISEEFGDLMFTMINLSRFLQINAENSLTNATDKFINRLVSIESTAKDRGLSLENMSTEELDVLWKQMKQAE